MKISQAFKMSFKSIVKNKVRSFLTMLGIIIGVAAVIILVSLVQGLQQQTQEYYEKQGTNKIDVSASNWNGKDVTNELYDYCLSLDDLVIGVTPNQQYWGTVKFRSKSTQSATIYFGSDQYSVCNNFQLAEGRDLSYMDIQNRNRVCVIGSFVKETLFNYVDPVGKNIYINGERFTVAGVYAEKDGSTEYSMDCMIVVPYTQNRLLMKQTTMTEFTVKAKDSASTDEAVARLNLFLGTIIDPNSGYFWVYSQNNSMEQNNQYTTMLSLVLGGIAGIALLVGGIGIMNIMLVTVTERTREIGIRKAVGAERGAIIIQFLIESGVISAVGGLFGILFGTLVTLVLGKVLMDIIIFPTTFISVGAFLFSVCLGIGFGMYPAVKASGLQPVVALRAE